jgi:hypothetical protein
MKLILTIFSLVLFALLQECHSSTPSWVSNKQELNDFAKELDSLRELWKADKAPAANSNQLLQESDMERVLSSEKAVLKPKTADETLQALTSNQFLQESDMERLFSSGRAQSIKFVCFIFSYLAFVGDHAKILGISTQPSSQPTSTPTLSDNAVYKQILHFQIDLKLTKVDKSIFEDVSYETIREALARFTGIPISHYGHGRTVDFVENRRLEETMAISEESEARRRLSIPYNNTYVIAFPVWVALADYVHYKGNATKLFHDLTATLNNDFLSGDLQGAIHDIALALDATQLFQTELKVMHFFDFSLFNQTDHPTIQPSGFPTSMPSTSPSSFPSGFPTAAPNKEEIVWTNKVFTFDIFLQLVNVTADSLTDSEKQLLIDTLADLWDISPSDLQFLEILEVIKQHENGHRKLVSASDIKEELWTMSVSLRLTLETKDFPQFQDDVSKIVDNLQTLLLQANIEDLPGQLSVLNGILRNLAGISAFSKCHPGNYCSPYTGSVTQSGIFESSAECGNKCLESTTNHYVSYVPSSKQCLCSPVCDTLVANPDVDSYCINHLIKAVITSIGFGEYSIIESTSEPTFAPTAAIGGGNNNNNNNDESVVVTAYIGLTKIGSITSLTTNGQTALLTAIADILDISVGQVTFVAVTDANHGEMVVAVQIVLPVSDYPQFQGDKQLIASTVETVLVNSLSELQSLIRDEAGKLSVGDLSEVVVFRIDFQPFTVDNNNDNNNNNNNNNDNTNNNDNNDKDKKPDQPEKPVDPSTPDSNNKNSHKTKGFWSVAHIAMIAAGGAVFLALFACALYFGYRKYRQSKEEKAEKSTVVNDDDAQSAAISRIVGVVDGDADELQASDMFIVNIMDDYGIPVTEEVAAQADDVSIYSSLLTAEMNESKF